jgi:large subunit ribosomal protein LP0
LNDAPDYERILPFVKGNVGFVFTNADLKTIRESPCLDSPTEVLLIQG